MDKKLKEYFSSLGKKSVAKRFKGKTKAEISEMMKKVRKSNKLNKKR